MRISLYRLNLISWSYVSRIAHTTGCDTTNSNESLIIELTFDQKFPSMIDSNKIFLRKYGGGLLFIPDLAVEEVSHVFRAAFYS